MAPEKFTGAMPIFEFVTAASFPGTYAGRISSEMEGRVMKKASKVILLVVIGLAVAASTGFAEDIKYSGFLGNPSVYSLLKPGPEGGAKLRWLKDGMDPKKYDKFMVDSVIFFLSDQADYKGIDPQEMKDLCDEFNKALVAAFKDKYPIVAEPGPNVMRIRVAITDIKPSRPGVSTVTSIIPVGLGVSLVKKGATGGWAGSGETGMEMMVLDSMTDEIIALAVDQRKAEFEQRFSKWGSATDAFKFWSEKTVAGIDNVKGVKREPKQ